MILTDEKLEQELMTHLSVGASRLFVEAARIGAQAQHKADVEYLEQPCPHGLGDFRDDDEYVVATLCYRRACDQCWQEFKEAK